MRYLEIEFTEDGSKWLVPLQLLGISDAPTCAEVDEKTKAVTWERVLTQAIRCPDPDPEPVDYDGAWTRQEYARYVVEADLPTQADNEAYRRWQVGEHLGLGFCIYEVNGQTLLRQGNTVRDATAAEIALWNKVEELNEPRRREINFVGDGTLAQSFGLSFERCQEIDQTINFMIRRNCSTQEILRHFSESEYVNEKEWAVIVFNIGLLHGRLGG